MKKAAYRRYYKAQNRQLYRAAKGMKIGLLKMAESVKQRKSMHFYGLPIAKK